MNDFGNQGNMDVSQALGGNPQGMNSNQQVPQQQYYQQQPYYGQPQQPQQRFGGNGPIPTNPQPQYAPNPYQQQQVPQQVPQAPIPQQEPPVPQVVPAKQEEPKVPEVKPEEKKETPPVDEKEIEQDLKEKEEQKKEEIKEEIKGKDDDYINNIVGNLLEDNTKLEFESQKNQKEKEFYHGKYEELRKEMNDLKYDERKMTVREEFKPLLKLLEQRTATPEDKEVEYRLISTLYEQLSQVTKEDYRNNITGYYQNRAQIASKLSQTPNGAGSNPAIKVEQQYKPKGIVKATGRSRF